MHTSLARRESCLLTTMIDVEEGLFLLHTQPQRQANDNTFQR